MRKTQFTNHHYYHIYNRGVDKRAIFLDNNDFKRFLLAIQLLNDKVDGRILMWRDYKKTHPRAKLLDFLKLNPAGQPLVEIIAYCLNPNHIHLLLKQTTTEGVKNFMHKLSTSYTNYFNIKYRRNGSLFQGPFKSTHIDSDEYLVYLSAYINRNHFIHGYGQGQWKYCSLPDYLRKRNNSLCNPKTILAQFKHNIKKYEEFVLNNALYMKERKETERYLLE